MQYSCQPRLSWENCPAETKSYFVPFNSVTLTLHLYTLLIYIVLFFHRYAKNLAQPISRQNSFRNNPTQPEESSCCGNLLELATRVTRKSFHEYYKLLTTKISLGVIFYSLMASINHLSLLKAKPLLPPIINEVTFNCYNLGIFLTLMLLIRYWALLPTSMTDKSEEYERIARIAFYVIGSMVAVFIFTCDIVMATIPSSVDYIIMVQHLMWGFGCIINGIAYGIFGNRLIKAITDSQDKVNQVSGVKEKNSLLLKLKVIYYVYIFISIPYAVLYFIVTYAPDESYIIWLFTYSIFNVAGPLTATILIPLI